MESAAEVQSVPVAIVGLDPHVDWASHEASALIPMFAAGAHPLLAPALFRPMVDVLKSAPAHSPSASAGNGAMAGAAANGSPMAAQTAKPRSAKSVLESAAVRLSRPPLAGAKGGAGLSAAGELETVFDGADNATDAADPVARPDDSSLPVQRAGLRGLGEAARGLAASILGRLRPAVPPPPASGLAEPAVSQGRRSLYSVSYERTVDISAHASDWSSVLKQSLVHVKAIGHDGRMYLQDELLDLVVLDRDGRLLHTIEGPALFGGVDGAGNVYVPNPDDKTVQVYDDKGVPAYLIQFSVRPDVMRVDDQGQLFIQQFDDEYDPKTAGPVLVLDRKGKFIGSMKLEDASRQHWIIDSRGHLYVHEMDSSNQVVNMREYSVARGGNQLLRELAFDVDKFISPVFAVDRGGRVNLVSNLDTFFVLTPQGLPMAEMRLRNGEVDGPMFDGAGNIYLIESRGRVHVLQGDFMDDGSLLDEVVGAMVSGFLDQAAAAQIMTSSPPADAVERQTVRMAIKLLAVPTLRKRVAVEIRRCIDASGRIDYQALRQKLEARVGPLSALGIDIT